MSVYHGKTGVVYLAATTGGVAINVIKLTAWSLDQKKDKQDATGFNDGNKSYVVGFKDLTGKISGHWDNTDTTLFSAADQDAPVNMYLYPTSLVTGAYFYGTAWVDAAIDVGITKTVTVDGEFVAAAGWGRIGL